VKSDTTTGAGLGASSTQIGTNSYPTVTMSSTRRMERPSVDPIAFNDSDTRRRSVVPLTGLRILFIRNGESENRTLARKIDGQAYSRLRDPDPPLSSVGRNQVEAIADFLTGVEGKRMFNSVDELLVSPCCRALQTASILSQRLGVPATVSTTLHEVGGLWPNETTGEDPRSVSGATPTEMERWCPGCAIPPSVTQDGWYNLAAGREKDTAARVRAGDFILGAFDSIAEKDPTKLHVVAVVTHGAFLSMLLGILMAPGADMGALPQFKHASGGISICDINHDGMVTCLAINETRHLPNDLRWVGVAARASNPWLQRRSSNLETPASTQGAEEMGLVRPRASQNTVMALDADARSSGDFENEDGRARAQTSDTEDSADAESGVSIEDEEGGVMLDEALLNSLMQSAVADAYGSGIAKALSGGFERGSGSSRRSSLEGGSGTSRRGSVNLGSNTSRRGSNVSRRQSASSLGDIHEDAVTTADMFARAMEMELETPNNTPNLYSECGLAEGGSVGVSTRLRSASQSSAVSQTSSAADVDEMMTRELLAQESNLSTMANLGSTRTLVTNGSMSDATMASPTGSVMGSDLSATLHRSNVTTANMDSMRTMMSNMSDVSNASNVSDVSNISTLANAGSNRTLGGSEMVSQLHGSSAFQRKSSTLGDSIEATWQLTEDDMMLPDASRTEMGAHRPPAAPASPPGQQPRAARARSEESAWRSSASTEPRRNSLTSRGSNGSDRNGFAAAGPSSRWRSSAGGPSSVVSGSAPSAVANLPSRSSFREQKELSPPGSIKSSFRQHTVSERRSSSRLSFTDGSTGGGDVRTNRTWSEERRASAPAATRSSQARGSVGDRADTHSPRRPSASASGSGYTFTVAGVNVSKDGGRSIASETPGGVTEQPTLTTQSSSKSMAGAVGGASASGARPDSSSGAGDSWLSARRKKERAATEDGESGEQPRRKSTSKNSIASKYLEKVQSTDVADSVTNDAGDAERATSRTARTRSIAELKKTGLVKQLSGLWAR